MVGDMAGIVNLVMARDADVALSPSIHASGLIVCREVEGGVIHLRGWQRVDLNNGESDMRARGMVRQFAGEAIEPDGSGPRPAQFPVDTFWCCAVHSLCLQPTFTFSCSGGFSFPFLIDN
jgi:hypothetical protein